MVYTHSAIYPPHDIFQDIRMASLGLILSASRLAKGKTLDLDKKELRGFGSCLQTLCEQGLEFTHPFQEELSMFPRHTGNSRNCLEGIYLALKVEREYIQNSDLSTRLKNAGITSLDSLAQALQSDSLKPEQYFIINEVFKKWYALSDEMVSVGAELNIAKTIIELINRFPTKLSAGVSLSLKF